MKRISRMIALFLLAALVAWGSGARAEDDAGGQDAEFGRQALDLVAVAHPHGAPLAIAQAVEDRILALAVLGLDVVDLPAELDVRVVSSQQSARSFQDSSIV